MPYVILSTSEVVEELPPGIREGDYAEVDPFDFLSRPEYESDVEPEDESWKVAHYLKKKGHLQAELASLVATFNLEKRRIESTLTCLDYRYLEAVEFLAGELLSAQGGKKKSVNHEFGKVGWRKDTKIVLVKDREEEVVAWCEANGYAAAVKVEKTVRKRELPTDEEIPGVVWPSGQIFYARPAK